MYPIIQSGLCFILSNALTYSVLNPFFSRQSYTNDVDTDNMSNVPYVRLAVYLVLSRAGLIIANFQRI